MGNTLNAYGKPVYTDAFNLPLDLQAAVDFADEFANVRRGTSAQRQALVSGKRRAGMLWVETDTGSIYRCDNALAWVLVVEPELRPGSVVGGTVDSFGGIVPTSGGTTVRVNNVFSSRFRIYRINFWLSVSTDTGGLGVNLVAAGAPHTAANHHSERLVANGATVTASSSSGSNAWSGSGITGSNLSGEWIIRNPATTGIKSFSADASRAPGLAFSQERAWLGSADSTIFDGFQFNASAGTFLGGYVKVQPVG
ncbi:hypothetical protein ACI3KS_05085 [Microbacterium sp. ZW T5_45]|uniref:hypothetical protein n=1 Tax=Microbacterium sp. ZW T5_45 TaxID=3378080 RepID=UPI0038526389